MLDNSNTGNSKESLDERLNMETRPPDGQRLILHSLRFAEVIKLEDYDKLEEGLDHLYEETLHFDNVLVIPSEQESYRNFIANSKKAFLSGGWVNLQGFVSKAFAESHKYGVITKPVRELPGGITSLSFFLRQLIPSMIVVLVRVDYEESVSDSLNAIFSEYHGERIEKHEHHVSHVPPDIVKAEKVQEFLTGLQSVSESFVSQYFAGVFLSTETKDVQYKCPSIKLYSLQDIPFTPVERLATWIEDHRHFIHVLGYTPVSSLVFRLNNEYLLFERSTSRNRETPMSLSLLSSESLFETAEAHNGYGTAISALRYKHQIAFDNLLSLVAFHHLMFLHSRRFINHRNRLSDYKIDIGMDFNDLKKQYSAIYNVKVLINNDYFDFIMLSQELEEITSTEAEKWLYRDTAEFELLENLGKRPHFAKALVSNIKFIASSLNRKYSLLNERYSDLFESVSTRSNFAIADLNNRYSKRLSYLTWALFCITVVMTLAVIVQIVR